MTGRRNNNNSDYQDSGRPRDDHAGFSSHGHASRPKQYSATTHPTILPPFAIGFNLDNRQTAPLRIACPEVVSQGDATQTSEAPPSTYNQSPLPQDQYGLSQSPALAPPPDRGSLSYPLQTQTQTGYMSSGGDRYMAPPPSTRFWDPGYSRQVAVQSNPDSGSNLFTTSASSTAGLGSFAPPPPRVIPKDPYEPNRKDDLEDERDRLIAQINTILEKGIPLHPGLYHHQMTLLEILFASAEWNTLLGDAAGIYSRASRDTRLGTFRDFVQSCEVIETNGYGNGDIGHYIAAIHRTVERWKKAKDNYQPPLPKPPRQRKPQSERSGGSTKIAKPKARGSSRGGRGGRVDGDGSGAGGGDGGRGGVPSGERGKQKERSKDRGRGKR